MTIIFEDDFELGDFKPDWLIEQLNATAEISNIQPNSGIYHARFYSPSALGGVESYGRCSLIMHNPSHIFARGIFYINEGLPLPAVDDRFYLIRAESNGSFLCSVGVYKDLDGLDKLRLALRIVDTTIPKMTTFELTPGPHLIEMEYMRDIIGHARVYLDEVLVLETLGVNTNVLTFNKLSFGFAVKPAGSPSSFPVDIYLDDAAWGDTYLGPPIGPQHNLTIDSTPVTGIPFTLNGVAQATPYGPQLIGEGLYTIVMPPSVIIGETTYQFVSWEDASTDPMRTINLTSDMAVTAIYQAVVLPRLTINSVPVEDIPFNLEKTA